MSFHVTSIQIHETLNSCRCNIRNQDNQQLQYFKKNYWNTIGPCWPRSPASLLRRRAGALQGSQPPSRAAAYAGSPPPASRAAARSSCGRPPSAWGSPPTSRAPPPGGRPCEAPQGAAHRRLGEPYRGELGGSYTEARHHGLQLWCCASNG